MTLSRRSLITGLVSFAVTAPSIVRAASLMPVKVMEPLAPAFQVAPLFYKGHCYWVAQDEVQIIRWSQVGDASRWIVDSYNLEHLK